jgi:hypothetical protein
MKATYSALLGFPPVWLLSALLHSMDPDVNGISGLADLEILVSVTFIGLLLYLPVLFPLAALHSRDVRGYWLWLVGVSCAVGAFLAAGGSSATNVQEWLVSFVGLTLVCLFVYLIATLPSILMRKYSRLRP